MNTVIDHLFRVGDYLAGGGPVMAPLLAVSFVLWLLIAHKSLVLRRLSTTGITRRQAGELIAAGRTPPAECTGINAVLVRHFLARRTGNAAVDGYILDEIVLHLVFSLNRHLSVIAVLAAIAPLLGLLGTVTGMVATFDALTLFGTGNARALAGGISEALITTQAGLLVAIPGFYMSGFLARRTALLKQRAAALGMYMKRFL